VLTGDTVPIGNVPGPSPCVPPARAALACRVRTLLVHVGASKTGTSALQYAFWASLPVLREAGIGVPFEGRKEHVKALLRPLGWQISVGFTRDVRERWVEETAAVLKDTPGDRLLISNEDLAELDEPRVALFHEAAAAADLQPEIILSARDWSRQLPSEWQQFLKHRLATPYPEFLEQVRDRADTHASRHFWQRQDFADICRRWAAGLPPERVHVVAVGSQTEDPGGVYRAFGTLLQLDPDRLRLPDHHVNASFGYTEAEVYRRLNEALGDRLPAYGTEYIPSVRTPIIRGAIPREASSRITLPTEHVDWVRQEGRRQVEEIRRRGYTVHGDPESLIAASDAGRPLPELSEREVAVVAVGALANFATREYHRT
jgi:hypothetical protein